MCARIHVHMLPDLVPSVSESTVVVIDVLRATTTMSQALAAGAIGIVPVLTIEEAHRQAGMFDPPALTGGERGGRPIDGFDLGNSPADYTAERVGGRWIVFTTTNGTRAIHACRGAQRVLLGAFVNLSAVCDALSDARQIDIVCAGTRGQITREDVLAAGAITMQLAGEESTSNGTAWELNDQAHLAMDAWQRQVQHMTGATWLAQLLRRTEGGRNLLDIGLDDDLDWAAELDRLELVPVWDAQTNRITAPTS